MDTNQAACLWYQLCLETVGSNGATVERITTLGSIATSHGLPHYCGNADKSATVAAWLRQWADALESKK